MPPRAARLRGRGPRVEVSDVAEGTARRDGSSEDAKTIGRAAAIIRRSHGWSQQVVADRAGISKSYLSRLEAGKRAIDSRNLIVALARALEVSPTELTQVALPGISEDGLAPVVDEVRIALLGAGMGASVGEVVPPEVLRARVAALLDDQQACRHEAVGATLPGLIGDLHATMAAGRDGVELAQLAVLLHVQGAMAWLRDVGGPLDLGWQAASIAQREAQRVDAAPLLGIAAFGTGHGLLAAGAFDLAARQLATATSVVPTADVAGQQLVGMLTFSSSLVSAARRERSEAAAALDVADELAVRTGESNAWWFGFGPTNVGVWRMSVALESGEHPAAARIAEALNPAMIPSPQRRAAYWSDYARALTRMRGRIADASAALRQAERISPHRLRHPFMRETLAELRSKAPAGVVGREIRGMAHRAGLPG
jgi:transcriptional regulator with XRE-family HTH domain